jgi:putative endonuclease
MGTANTARGRYGEGRVARWYVAAGYEVVARNWRDGPRGELDLIVRRGDEIVVCEVKSRASNRFGTPAEAVDWRKQRRIRQLTAQWLREYDAGWVQVRFDVAEVVGTDVRLIEAAF